MRKLATGPATTTDAPTQSTECTICLSSIAVSLSWSSTFIHHHIRYFSNPPTEIRQANTFAQPCQSLFIAPCSHTWHYKCIRPIIQSEYPAFLCPNCRAVADLEEDIEEPESWDNESAQDEAVEPQAEAGPSNSNANVIAPAVEPGMVEAQAAHTIPILEEDNDDDGADHDQTQLSLGAHDTSSSTAIPIPGQASTGSKERMDTDIQVGESAAGQSVRMQLPARALQQILEQESADNVLTPRNDIGPFAF